MKSTGVVFMMFFLITEILGQSVKDREHIISHTNVERLNQISEDYWQLQNQYKEEAAQKRLLDGKSTSLFSHIDKDGQAVYYSTENESSARSSRIDLIRTGGSAGLDLDGRGLEFGLWDSGNPLATHQEFIGKIKMADVSTPSSHSSHVAGMLVATGIDAEAKGMAPGATLASYTSADWISEIALWAAEGGMISSHSYIVQNPREDFEKFGIYNEIAQVWDEFSYNAPYLMMCTGASNNGNNDYNPDNSRFDLLASNKLGKNSIVVGACSDVIEYTGPESVQQAVFTSWGPTDDWRIKPDLTAVGTDSYSTGELFDTNYRTGQGSSFAVPVVSGGLALLQQLYHDLNGIYMKSTTAKALILSTADEAGLHDGPDFSNGWGLFNAKRAADVISGDGTASRISELTLDQDDTYSITINTDGTQPLTVAICWNDPSAVPLAAQAFNDRTVMLVNDLDVRVASDTVEYYPWRMEPNAEYNNFTDGAIKGDNFRDNIEVINAGNVPAGEYTLMVSHKGTLQSGQQDFSLIINGVLADLSSNSNTTSLEDHITVYPNPVHDYLNLDIDTEVSKELSISIYDLTGQKQNESVYYNQKKIQFNVSDLPQGAYFLKIQDKESDLSMIQKIIRL